MKASFCARRSRAAGVVEREMALVGSEWAVQGKFGGSGGAGGAGEGAHLMQARMRTLPSGALTTDTRWGDDAGPQNS